MVGIIFDYVFMKHCLYFKKKAVKIGAPKFWPSYHYSSNGFRSKLDIPVSLDTKCTFGGVSHDSVENAQKSILNGKFDNFDPPPEKELRLVQTRNALLVDFHIKVLKMHRKQYKME